MGVIRSLQNLRIDLLTQRTFLGGSVTSIDNYQMVLSTSNSGYEQLELIFFYYYPINKNDVIIDVGCGRGRVFNYLLYKGLKNRMIGYEINQTVGNKTKQNLARYKNVEIRSENIFNNFPKDGNVFYLFNPFRERMVTEFKNNIWKLRDKNPVILYYNPEYLEIFNDTRFTYEIKDIPMLQSGYEVKLAIIKIVGRKR